MHSTRLSLQNQFRDYFWSGSASSEAIQTRLPAESILRIAEWNSVDEDTALSQQIKILRCQDNIIISCLLELYMSSIFPSLTILFFEKFKQKYV